MAEMTITRRDIEAARAAIGGHIVRTPVLFNHKLSELCGCRTLFKLENLQVTGSFKERGALNRLLALSDDERRRGVATASSGNHAQGVAYHCRRLGIRACIVMPLGTPLVKVTSTRNYGADVVIHGDTFDDAYARAQELAAQEGLTLVHPFADPLVIAGQGTIGVEILDDPLCRELDAVICPIGGGGLIGGIGAWIKETRPGVAVYGVESAVFPTLGRALEAGGPVELLADSSFADGIAVRRTSELNYELVKRYVDKVVAVPEHEIANAVLLHLETQKVVVEASGAVPLAALVNRRLDLAGKTVVCVVSGGNIDVNVLNHIITRGLAFEGRIVRLTIRLKDRPGALRDALDVIRRLQANILEIGHHRYDFAAPFGYVDVSITAETKGREHVAELQAALRKAGYLGEGGS